MAKIKIRAQYRIVQMSQVADHKLTIGLRALSDIKADCASALAGRKIINTLIERLGSQRN